MTRPALRVLGLAAIVAAVWFGGPWTLVAAAGAAAVASGRLRRYGPRRQGTGPTRISDFPYTLDLLRRAVGAQAAWATGMADGPIAVPEDADGDRGAAIVALAAGDSRQHVSREPAGTYLAVGDFPYGAGVLLGTHANGDEIVLEELRRLVGGMRLAELEEPQGPAAIFARELAVVAAGSATLEGVARAGADFAHRLTQRGVAIVVRDGDERVRVVAVAAADRRLEGLVLDAEAPVARAIWSGVPVVAGRNEDVFGAGTPERRRREREGIAYPLKDANSAVAALVIIGPAVDAEHVSRFVQELGPRLASVRALQDAERRATTDPLTGLANRAVFMRRLREVQSNGRPEAGTLIYVDLDHFKMLNDTHGHAAGDGALRHVAEVFRTLIRGRDLVARIGGEEFAVWLPGAPLVEGMMVAERIRRRVEEGAWLWGGSPWTLTVSCGVAAHPDHAVDADNLMLLADKALYQAKQGGRNRVEKAGV